MAVYLKRFPALVHQIPFRGDQFGEFLETFHMNSFSQCYSYFMVFLASYLSEKKKALPFNNVRSPRIVLNLTTINPTFICL